MRSPAALDRPVTDPRCREQRRILPGIEPHGVSDPSVWRRGRAGARRALAFPSCGPLCPVAGNDFAGGFIVAAAACCGQTIGGHRLHALITSIAASVSVAALIEPIPPRSGARVWPPLLPTWAPSIACTQAAR
jgi:hypothetical protein